MKRLVNAALHDRHSLMGLRPWRRHSLVIGVLGIVYLLTGVLYIGAPSSPFRNSALRVALDLLPWTGWGIVWIIGGALAIVSSRWPIPSDTWGYTVLAFIAALWSSFYAFGFLYGAPAAGLTQSLIWGGVAFTLWAISGLVNPVNDKEPEQ